MAFMNNGYYPSYQIPQNGMYQSRMPQMDYGGQMQLKGRPVSSIDEAKAAQVDFDGSMFFFPDMAHQKIYTKQIMMDGTASINTYAFVEEKNPPTPSYVTREEFDKTIQELKNHMKPVERNRNDEPNASVSQSNDQLTSF